MKRVTASEARGSWFRLLDEVAGGEVVEIDRRGVRIVIRREPGDTREGDIPDYRALITARGVDRADGWSWEWTGTEGGVVPRDEEDL